MSGVRHVDECCSCPNSSVLNPVLDPSALGTEGEHFGTSFATRRPISDHFARNENCTALYDYDTPSQASRKYRPAIEP